MKLSDFIQDIGRPVAYYPKLTNITGGVRETILLCQLLYWNGKQANRDGWIYKTQEDIFNETGLKRYGQEVARNELKKKDFIEEKKKGSIPAKLHFRVKTEKIDKAWQSFVNQQNADGRQTGMQTVDKQESRGSANSNAEGLQTNTETTSDITTETTSNDNSKELSSAPKVQSDSSDEISLNYAEQTKQVIQYWNTLQKATRHSRPATKVYKRAAEWIDNLLSGKPLLCNKDGSPHKSLENFFTKFNLNENLLRQKFSESEIKGIIKRVHDEDLRSDRKWSLCDILWNGFAGRNQSYSYFYIKAAQVKVARGYVLAAKKLADVVNPGADTGRINSWARELEGFIESGGSDLKTVRLIFDWYDDHYDEKYTPRADDMSEFIDKFKKFYRQMKRSENEKEDSEDWKNSPMAIKMNQPEKY